MQSPLSHTSTISFKPCHKKLKGALSAPFDFLNVKEMTQSSEFLEQLIRKVDLTGCNDALCDISLIVELNTFFRSFSIEDKIERFNPNDRSYKRKLIEIILTKEEIAEIGEYFLQWAKLPKKVVRQQILSILRNFLGEIGASVILEIIQKYGNEFTYSGSMSSEIESAISSLADAFFWNRDFDDVKARELLTEMNPIPFLEKYIDFPDDDENEIASSARFLLESFTQILDGYIFNIETNELHPPQHPIS